MILWQECICICFQAKIYGFGPNMVGYPHVLCGYKQVVPHLKKMKIVLTILISITTTLGYSCDCYYEITDSIPLELYDSVDMIAYARVIDDSPIQNGALEGHVKLKVDSVFKGNYAKGQSFYSNQTGSGNCIKFFSQGDFVLILGFKLNHFEKIEHDNRNHPYPPPPVYDRQKDGNFRSSVFNEADLEYWNTLASQSLIIYTNQCLVMKK